jgi:GNAT superfamily N-acetyltransferase
MIRPAKSSDRDEILDFCTHTFSWGDYIDQVWDAWQREGMLLVAESDNRKIAMAHAALCPGKRQVWLEGVRVHPDYRRSKVATALIEKMLKLGRQQGAQRARAIVAADNTASRRMMEKNGFAVAAQWAYYSTDCKMPGQRSSARVATAKDIGGIWEYLCKSKIYEQSAKTYVKEWRWYPLDRRAIARLVRDRRVVVTGKPIEGVAVINRVGYWKRTNVLQVVYLDSASKDSLRQLVSHAAGLYMEGGYERLHILCHKSLAPAVKSFRIEESEQFLLYDKALFT